MHRKVFAQVFDSMKIWLPYSKDKHTAGVEVLDV